MRIDSPLRPSVLALVAGLALAASLSGCDRDDPSATAVRNSGNQLRTVGGGGGPGLPAAQDKAFKAVQKDLTQIASQDSRTGTAAVTLVSQSNLGMSDASLGALIEAETAAREKMNEARYLLATWGGRSAVAAAAEAFDPAADLSALRKQRDDLRAEIASSQQRLESVQKQVADLAAQAKAKMEAADAKYAQFNALSREASSKSATDSLPLVEKAHAAKREGDALRLAGDKIQAEADRVFPQIAESLLYVDQFTNQTKSIDQSEKELLAEHEAAKKAASDARADANKAAGDLDSAVKAVDEIHSKQIQPARDAAMKNLSDAAKNATKGSRDSAAAKLTLGSAKQGIADLHWSSSQSLSSYARFLQSLANAKPKLPNADQYAAKANELTEAAKKEVEDARQAFGEAAAAFGSVSLQGAKDAKERLNALSELLKKSSQTAEEAAADSAATTAAAALADAAKPEKDATPAVEAAGATDPAVVAALDGYIKIVGSDKPSDLLAILDVPEESKGNVKTLLEIGDKFTKLDAACKAKVGGSLTDAMKTMPGGGGMAGGMDFGSVDTEKLKTMKAADFTWKVEGDTASASNAAFPKPIEFKKVDGAWKVSEPQLVQMSGMAAAMAAPIAGIADALTVEVEAGTYKSADEVAAAFQKKLMEMMGGGMAPKGPPGKRGPGGG